MITRALRIIESIWDAMSHMPNIPSKATNLPYPVWYSTKDGVQHGPRVKVRPPGEEISITIEDFPRVIGNSNLLSKYHINLYIKWILINKDLLLKVWNKEISPQSFKDLMQPLEK